jgi:hypothetical protein
MHRHLKGRKLRRKVKFDFQRLVETGSVLLGPTQVAKGLEEVLEHT